MKIITWNVNSIKTRLHLLDQLINEENPDIILLQELKCEDSKFPHDQFDYLNYNTHIHGQKTYNGVAILSKYKADSEKKSFQDNPLPKEARFIEIDVLLPIGFTKIISVYVPNGGEINSDKFNNKIIFLKKLIKYLEFLRKSNANVIIGGDFNIAPFEIDTYNKKYSNNTTCSTLKEQKLMRKILNLQYIDLLCINYPKKEEFTWWDYRKNSFQQNHGMRIDFILSTPSIAKYLKSYQTITDYRKMIKTSDHAPLIAHFTI